MVGSRPFSAAAIMGAASMANAEPSAMAACRCPTAQGRRRGHHLEAEQRQRGRRQPGGGGGGSKRPSAVNACARGALLAAEHGLLGPASACTHRSGRGSLRARQRRPSCQEERGGGNMQPASGDCGGRLNR